MLNLLKTEVQKSLTRTPKKEKDNKMHAYSDILVIYVTHDQMTTYEITSTDAVAEEARRG